MERDWYYAVVAAREDARIVCRTSNRDVEIGDMLIADGSREFIGYKAATEPEMIFNGSSEEKILLELMGGRLPEIRSVTRVVWQKEAHGDDLDN